MFILLFIFFIVGYFSFNKNLNESISIEKERVHIALGDNDPAKHVRLLCGLPSGFALFKESAYELPKSDNSGLLKYQLCCSHINIINPSDPVGVFEFIRQCDDHKVVKTLCKDSKPMDYSTARNQAKKRKLYYQDFFHRFEGDTESMLRYICPS
jgi:hypothetical protein